jgi:hypothetical protein
MLDMATRATMVEKEMRMLKAREIMRLVKQKLE